MLLIHPAIEHGFYFLFVPMSNYGHYDVSYWHSRKVIGYTEEEGECNSV
jgi:hypothetical protein